VGMTVAGLLCHGRLAADRPPTRHLTEFYLWVALGGALGGAFNAVLAPLVFPGLVEYPLAIVAACLLRPPPPKRRPDFLEFFLKEERPTRWMDVGVPMLLGAAVALILLLAGGEDGVSNELRSVVAGFACGLTVNMARRPLRFGLALGAIFLAVSLAGIRGESVLERDRSFFGTYEVSASEGGRLHELYSGTTLHGAEREGPGPPEQLSYYSLAGPAGQAFAELPPETTGRVAAIGLGAGAIACNMRSGAAITFYEIDEAVVKIARDPELFSFLRDCPVRPRVVVGDGRRSLRAEPQASVGLVVVDAFNSDAIPLHLITREAVRLYLSRTTAGGSLLFHLSNRYLDLEPAVGNIARDLGLTCRFQHHRPDTAGERRGYEESDWALLARAPEHLGVVAADNRWRECRTDPSKDTWTDDYSNPLSVIDWG
jgi:hypothetical protein